MRKYRSLCVVSRRCKREKRETEKEKEVSLSWDSDSKLHCKISCLRGTLPWWVHVLNDIKFQVIDFWKIKILFFLFFLFLRFPRRLFMKKNKRKKGNCRRIFHFLLKGRGGFLVTAAPSFASSAF